MTPPPAREGAANLGFEMFSLVVPLPLRLDAVKGVTEVTLDTSTPRHS